MSDPRTVKEKLFLATIFTLAVIGVAPVLHVIGTVVVKGVEAYATYGSKLLEPPATVLPGLVGSALLSVSATLLGVPLAIGAAFFVTEFPDTIVSRVVRVVSKSLLEVPTVLLGMLVYVVMVVPFKGFSLLAGSVALALVMLPYVMVHVEHALEAVPQVYREAGLSLGMTRGQVLLGVVAGIARRGIASGILMGFARAMGETAPLLFTIGASRSTLPCSLLDPGDAVPLAIFHYAQMPQPIYHAAAWFGALILVSSFLAVFAAVRIAVKEVRVWV